MMEFPDWDAYPIGKTSVSPQLPDVFLLPVCTTRERFIAMLSVLDAWKAYDETGLNAKHLPERDLSHMIDVLEAMNHINECIPCGQYSPPECPDPCVDCPPPEPEPIPTPELRQVGCNIEWLNPNSGEWESLLKVENCPAPTSAAAAGFDDECDECGDGDDCEEFDDCEEC